MPARLTSFSRAHAPGRVGAIGARFTRPVCPGDPLDVSAWRVENENPGSVSKEPAAWSCSTRDTYDCNRQTRNS
jgi:acyl dehydratase